MKKQRLDDLLIKNGLIEEKKEAFVPVTEGRVFVDGQKAISPSQPVAADARIEIRGGDEYVGRGAYKLEAALEAFKIDVEGKICADIGSATGGFTEVLLRRGAQKVYAIDTARGKLALSLRNDTRVCVMEETDVRHVELPEKIDIAAIDVSLIPLEGILPSVGTLLKKSGIVIALFKPQYQTRDQKDLRHGIVKDDETRERLITQFSEWAEKNNWKILQKIESPIKGDKGNVEYLFYLEYKT